MLVRVLKADGLLGVAPDSGTVAAMVAESWIWVPDREQISTTR
jgi:hypothetical protein